MNVGVVELVSNIGMTLENVLLLIIVLGGFIFYAQDYLIGVMLHFLATASLFVVEYVFKLDYSFALASCLIFLVVLCFSLYAVFKAQATGAVI